jgi:hypothetical protein
MLLLIFNKGFFHTKLSCPFTKKLRILSHITLMLIYNKRFIHTETLVITDNVGDPFTRYSHSHFRIHTPLNLLETY